MFFVLILSGITAIAQQTLTGNYKMQSGEASLTLDLTQQGNLLTGTLSSNTGASFQLNGQVENGIGYGTCTGTDGTVYFEAYLEGTDLTIGLIEMDQFNMPDYDKAQYLLFAKSTGSEAGKATTSVTDQQPAQQFNTQQNMPAGTTGSSSIGQNEVGDPSWGFKFSPPAGWVHQQSAEGVLLGHNSIAGMILVLPHMSENMQQLQMEMQKGIQEEGSSLTLSSGLQNIQQNVLGGDYTGVMDGTQVKARGFGVLSPYGSGAYIIAVSTPEGFSKDLLDASESIFRNMQYFKVEVSDLMQHFAGNWSHFTTNTSTWMCFCPDGTYSEQYESSYSGDFQDAGGNDAGGWGATGQDSSRGRWTVRGNKDAGTIVVSMANGKEIYYEYKVHVEKGEKYYSEYYFNGDFYFKKKE